MGAFAKPYVATWSILHAELIAIREAILFCLEAGFNNGEIVSECSSAVHLVNDGCFGEQLIPSCFLVEDIKSLLASNVDLFCTFDYRDAILLLIVLLIMHLVYIHMKLGLKLAHSGYIMFFRLILKFTQPKHSKFQFKPPESESQMDFPDEIVVDILQRLPVKSLVRFRCVSKSWRCLISDPIFVRTHLESHMAHISFGTASRIALSRKADTLLSLQAHESDGFAVAEELDLDLVKNSNYYVMGHCDGLLCLLIHDAEKSQLVIYNPSIREHRILPLPLPHDYICTAKPLD
ncbi:uncharacterized protein LOC112491013 [Ziziphus jujuba]|uniref:Uncharacterized protein LOC112491013 n=1 Tax=Ziziphus jujuba TaxID=326968 RepID=A0ABM3ICI3_ZIZJJ|nr:uncharacterized protein LOC112491013 [Ziziphus jujuba]